MTVPHFAISSLSLTGSLEQKLAAITDAGFDAIELGALDLSGSSNGVGGAIECIRSSGLRISALQEIKDFGGHSGRILAYKLELAKSYLRQMQRLGCRQLIVTPATSAHASPDLERTAEDLRILATLATPLGIRIGFKPLSWAPSVYTVRHAWEAIERAGNPNLNLVVDSFHLIARAESPEDLMDIPVARIGLVQLSDVAMSAFPALEDQIDIARHYRLFPGEGSHGGEIRDLVRFFRDTGYAGDYVFDVYNDKYLALTPEESIQHAVRSKEWILEKIGL